MSCAKMAEPIEMLFGIWTWVGPRNHVLDGVQIAPCEGAIFGERTCLGMPDNNLLWAVHKWLKHSRCHLGCGLEWAQGSTCYVGVHIGATWRIRLNHPCSVAVQKMA